MNLIVLKVQVDLLFIFWFNINLNRELRNQHLLNFKVIVDVLIDGIIINILVHTWTLMLELIKKFFVKYNIKQKKQNLIN